MTRPVRWSGALRSIAGAFVRLLSPLPLELAATARIRVIAIAVAIVAVALLLNGARSSAPELGIIKVNHAARSFELALNWQRCGVYPVFSSAPTAIRKQLAGGGEVLDLPGSRLSAAVVGPDNDYCATVDQPFLNNENTLALLIYAALRVWPDSSARDVGNLLRGTGLVLLGIWVAVALATGLSPALALLGLMVALQMQHALWEQRLMTMYPLLLPAMLLYAGLLLAVLRSLATSRVVQALLAAICAGLVAGLYYNLRTSHAPLILAGALLCAWFCWRVLRARSARVSVAGAAACAALLFIGGATFSHRTAVAPAVEFTGWEGSYPYHVVAHPLVLSLALPDNPFAAAQGIRWEDAVGIELARRVDPAAVYLGVNYEPALWRFYRTLWAEHPGEMLQVYLLKWQSAGNAIVSATAAASAPTSMVLWPLRWLGGGIGIALWLGLVLIGALLLMNKRPVVALSITLTAVFGLLLLFESALVYSAWNPFYQTPLVFALALTVLFAAQAVINGVAHMFRRFDSKSEQIRDRTIADFGTQWTTYKDTEGLFGSPDLLADFISPFPLKRFRGARVADIGAGTGRHASALLVSGAAQVVALEPSAAVTVIREQVQTRFPEQLTVLHCTGDLLPPTGDLDYAISIGVLHHIPEPEPVVLAVYEALKPGGQFVVWLYGREGNGLYLALVGALRPLTTRVPERLVAALAWLLDLPLRAYLAMCQRFPRAGLPLSDYLNNVLGRLPADKRRLVIYDQLRPRYARYYSRSEAVALMAVAPFAVEVHPRHGFSWLVIGTKPRQLPT